MTVMRQTNVAGPFRGNGLTTQWDYKFRVDEPSDLFVYLRDWATKIDVLIPPGEYTVTGIGSGSEEGGTVTYPLAGDPIGPEFAIVIERQVRYIQQASISNNGGFYPKVIEQALDQVQFQVQQVAEGLSRTPKFPTGVIDSNVTILLGTAGKVLGWDAKGNIVPMANSAAEAEVIAEEVRELRGEVFEDKVVVQQARIEAVASATTATSQADRAVLAANAATDSANVYPNIAAGLTATTNGQQFIVEVGNENVRYRNDSGVAVEVLRSPSSKVLSVVPDANKAPLADSSGVIRSTWLDRAGGVVLPPVAEIMIGADDLVPPGWWATGEYIGSRKIISNWHPTSAYGDAYVNAFLPSDTATMFQDYRAEIPVTSDDDPVALMFSRVNGELRIPKPSERLETNGDFETDTNGWSVSTSRMEVTWSSNEVTLAIPEEGGAGLFFQNVPVVPGQLAMVVVKGRVVSGAGTVRVFGEGGTSSSNRMYSPMQASAANIEHVAFVMPEADTIRADVSVYALSEVRIERIEVRSFDLKHFAFAANEDVRPTHKVNEGVHWLRGDGAQALTVHPDPVPNAGGAFVSLAVSVDEVAPGYSYRIYGGPVDSRTFLFYRAAGSATLLSYFNQYTGDTPTNRIAHRDMEDGVPYILTRDFDASRSPRHRGFVNGLYGVSATSDSLGGGDDTSNPGIRNILAASPGGVDLHGPMTGNIYGLIEVYRPVADVERRRIEDYMKIQLGIEPAAEHIWGVVV